MSAPIAIEGVPALSAVDVMGDGATDERIAQITAVHLRHFPDHPHVAEEMERAAREGTFDPEVVVHQWLLISEDQPVGEYIFHVNTRRGIVLRHFLAVDQPVRKGLPIRWIAAITAAVQRQGELDMDPTGRPLLAMMSEVSPHHLEGWRRLGYRTLDIGYREPYHGKHWADFGAPDYFEMSPCVRVTDAGAALPISAVAEAAAQAFLIDHYRLPADDPTVAGILARAQALTD